jgi:hypothetical protein
MLAAARRAARQGRLIRPAASVGATALSPTGPSVARDERPAPLRGIDVGERLRERPSVAGAVLGAVVPLAVLEVGRLHEDARAVCTGARAVGARVLDAYRHRVGDLTRPRRPAVVARLGDDDRPLADAELRAVVLADAQAPQEAEARAEPLDRLARPGRRGPG